MAAARALFLKGFVEDGANRLYYAVYEAGNAALKSKKRRVPGRHRDFLNLFDEVFADLGSDWEEAIREAEQCIDLIRTACFPDFTPSPLDGNDCLKRPEENDDLLH